MPTLKQLINRYLYFITLILIIFSLMIVSYIQVKLNNDHTYRDATLTLAGIEQIITENQAELELVQQDYRNTCLLNAKVISRLIESEPAILNNLEELQAVATHLEVDEIHIFDKNGIIISGTHPEHYGLSLDSGGQISYFLPLLEDTSLELVQDIAPNTAEEEMMQYSALWSKNKQYIIQVGMTSVNMEKVTAKNELSYIFSLFRINPNVLYFAIDAVTGSIVGTSDSDNLDIHCTDIGFSLNDINNSDGTLYVDIEGKDYYCIFREVNSNYICYAAPITYLYREIPGIIGVLFLCMLVIAFVLVFSFNEYMKVHIVDKLNRVNQLLTSITNGNLDQTVDVRNIYELSQLSTHINNMVQNLSTSNAKLTYILSRNHLYVGTYEYGVNSDNVQYSEYIPTLFALNESEMDHLSSHPEEFRQFLDSLRSHPLPEETNVYEVADKYIRLDEILDNGYTLGVVIDVTADLAKRQQLEFEIHLDSLTGLLNRAGIDSRLSKLFTSPEVLGHYAMITIRADGLAEINEAYGYENGDIYIQKVADLITDFGIRSSVAARQGGAEFLLFLYGYDNAKELEKAINLLSYMQNHSQAQLTNNIEIPIEFSFTYCLSDSSQPTDYHQLLKDANDNKGTLK